MKNRSRSGLNRFCLKMNSLNAAKVLYEKEKTLDISDLNEVDIEVFQKFLNEKISGAFP